MLGPILPAPGGGDARRPLAVASRRHRSRDSFPEALTRKATANTVHFPIAPFWNAGLRPGEFG